MLEIYMGSLFESFRSSYYPFAGNSVELQYQFTHLRYLIARLNTSLCVNR